MGLKELESVARIPIYWGKERRSVPGSSEGETDSVLLEVAEPRRRGSTETAAFLKESLVDTYVRACREYFRLPSLKGPFWLPHLDYSYQR